MLYLTRIILDKKAKDFSELYDCNSMHMFIMSLFPHVQTENARETANVLYRREDLTVYVQSSVLPVKQKDTRIASIDTKDISKLLELFQQGQTFRFNVYVNPTHVIKTVDRPEGKRVPIVKYEDQVAWLKRRMPSAIISNVQTGDPIIAQGYKGKNRIEVYGIELTGILRIENSQEFSELFEKGVGRSKAYGFGMLLIYK